MQDMQNSFDCYEEVPQEIKDRIRNEARKKGYKVKLISRQSNHPSDKHLFLVLGQGGRLNAYNVWLYNACWKEGLCEGHYDLTYKEALGHFVKQLKDIYN